MKLKHLFLFAMLGTFSVSCSQSPPSPVLPVPTANQIEWQKLEQYAFVHFGLNTFNDLEWGYGNTPESTFNPTDLDCNQWVAIIKAAGLKGVILTAKHHDGFCLWPTKTSEYSVKNSPWKNGEGDMVRSLSDACKAAGLKFGLYLSPWDRNNAHYGKEAYVATYHEQINELISNYGDLFEYWFDGANGGNGWYGGTNETRSIDPNAYYQFEKAVAMIKAKHPKAMIFGSTEPDIRWVGNEDGWAGQTNWSTYSRDVEKHYTENQWGHENGKQWLPAECDVSIRPGWFYHHREDHQVRSVGNLINLYYESVGRNANFLLNFPVALNGKIHPIDSARILDWHQTISNELKTNLLTNTKITASNDRGRGYAPENVLDKQWDTYWATEDGVDTGTLTFKMDQPTAINRLLLQEYIPLGQRVAAFHVEAEANGQWQAINTRDTLSTIGYKRIIRFSTVEVTALRINFTKAKGPLCINTIEAYLAPLLMEESAISRNGKDELVITTLSEDVSILYTTDGNDPQPETAKVYTAPVGFAMKGKVKAVTYDRQQKRMSPVSSRLFDIPSAMYQVNNITDPKTRVLFDGNAYSAFYLPEDVNEIQITIQEAQLISGFVYTPNQGRDAQGHISRYQFFVDNKMVSEGEFSNIKHNPIAQSIRFSPVKGKTVRLKIVSTVDQVKRVGIGEFSVLTE